MEKIKFSNAKVYYEEYKKTMLMDIYVERGKITGVVSCNSIEKSNINADTVIDLKGKIVLPGFIDSHLHFPGNMLYLLFGISLEKANSVIEYKSVLSRLDCKNYRIIRGYGWDQSIFLSDGVHYAAFKKFLDETFNETPVCLFSIDYHACLYNQAFLDLISGILISNGDIYENGLITERNVYQVLNDKELVFFDDDEIEAGILAYQNFLLSFGITSVQSLLFLGGSRFQEIEIFHKLDLNGKLKINCNLAITIYPEDNLDNIYCFYKEVRKYNSSKINISTIKFYIDGVIENSTALLLKPYKDTCNYGTQIWSKEQIAGLFRYFTEKNVQLHIHAIGDGALHMVADTLAGTPQIDKKNPNRHTVTHLQLAADDDLKILADYNILCALQPFWFPVDGGYLNYNIEKIGDRIFEEYKAKSIMQKGIHISFSSDSPVTSVPNPLAGISKAMRHSNFKERLTLFEAMNAYGINGAYLLNREKEIGKIEVGYWADFSVYEKDILSLLPFELENTKPVQVYYRGEDIGNTGN